MSSYNNIVDAAHQNGVQYHMSFHEPMYSAMDAKEKMNNELDQEIKTILMTDKNRKRYAVTIRADAKLDFAELAVRLETKRLRMMKTDEIKQMGLDVGSIAPFGFDDDIRCVIDRELEYLKKININPGLNDVTMTFAQEEFSKMVEHFGCEIGHFRSGEGHGR